MKVTVVLEGSNRNGRCTACTSEASSKSFLYTQMNKSIVPHDI